MDTGAILEKLKKALPGSVLEKQPFGRSQTLALWVESKKLAEVAAFLRDESGIRLGWLENLSAIQMDKSIVLTYFLRTSEPEVGGTTLILRASVDPASAAREVDFPSVGHVWEMAAPFESEIQEMFGVSFRGPNGEPIYPAGFRLPAGWKGYPLRKTYVFPSEFLGIAHARRSSAPEGNT